MTVTWVVGDALEVLRRLPSDRFACCVTSPPYWGLRDYGIKGQLGLEATVDDYVAHMVEVFREVRRVLRPDAVLWLNLGDSYMGSAGGQQGKNGYCAGRRAALVGARIRKTRRVAPGLKSKDLVGIPWRVAFALQADGWYLRADVIWEKLAPMPESVTDRPTRSHEYVFLLTRSKSYRYNAEAIATPLKEKTRTTYTSTRKSKGSDGLGKVAADNWSRDVPVRKPKLRADGGEYGANARSVWTIGPKPFKKSHFATFPPALALRCLLSGCPQGGEVLDPFSGAGTVGLVAARLGLDATLIELNPTYVEMARERLAEDRRAVPQRRPVKLRGV